MSQSFIVIGLDDSPAPQFAPEAMRAIGNARVFSGGTRHRAIVAPLLPPGSRWINIGAPVDQAFASYAEVDARQPIVVFASGDPLFYGFACTIRKRLPQADIRLYPAFNSLQLLAHRLLMPYGDMRIVSLTGRPWKEFDRALIEGACKIGVLTDLRHTPAAIARRMLDYGYSHYTMYVGERLGDTSAERVSQLTLDEAARSDFDRLCCLLLQADEQPAQPPFGIPDERFAHLPGRPGMITKRPIRLLALSALELPFRRVLWDIGFCTGSISIEARLQFPHLDIVAFEVRPECEELMRHNAQVLGAPGITVRMGDFMKTDLNELPRPDAVFIGGHGGQLHDMVARLARHLEPGGCLVLNAVSAQSADCFVQSARQAGLAVAPPMHVSIDRYNPIDVLKALRPAARI